MSQRGLSLILCCFPCILISQQILIPKIRSFADDCVCYHESKESKDVVDSLKLHKDKLGMLGKKVGYEVHTSQMQSDTVGKEKDKKGPCSLHLSGNSA